MQLVEIPFDLPWKETFQSSGMIKMSAKPGAWFNERFFLFDAPSRLPFKKHKEIRRFLPLLSPL